MPDDRDLSDADREQLAEREEASDRSRGGGSPVIGAHARGDIAAGCASDEVTGRPSASHGRECLCRETVFEVEPGQADRYLRSEYLSYVRDHNDLIRRIRAARRARDRGELAHLERRLANEWPPAEAVAAAAWIPERERVPVLRLETDAGFC